MAELFHTLPLSGGLFDQPAGYVVRMEAVLRATQNRAEASVSENKFQAQQRLDERIKAGNY